MNRAKCKEGIESILKLSSCGIVPPAIFVSGSVGCGKTFLMKQLLAETGVDVAIVKANEIYSSRLFYEAFIHGVHQATGSDAKLPVIGDNPASMFYGVDELLAAHHRPVFVLIERADLFLKNLQDASTALAQHEKFLKNHRLCVIFESRVAFHSVIYPKSAVTPVIFAIPEYSQQEVETILRKEKPDEISDVLFHNFIQAIMGYFYLSTHDLRLLKYVVQEQLPVYSQPVLDGSVSETSAILLWRKIEPTFRAARASLFLKSSEEEENRVIDLPFFSKHLLIASYLASFNPPKTDKRYFLKNAGKVKKKRSFRGPEVKQRLIGPLQFSMDRLIAIFESITETEDRSISILSQLRTLVRLKLITIASSDTQILQPKLKCNCSEDFITKIAHSVRFELGSYLFDNV